MLSGHSIVTINNYDLIQVSDIKNYSANFNPHLYFILGVSRWYFKKVRSYFFDRTKVKYTVISEDGIKYSNTFRLEDKKGNLLKINKLEISRDSLFLTINGTEKYSATNIMLNDKNFIPAFKILYIGQAKGNDFNIFAQDRLKSHSTLQNILSQIIDSRIIYDIKVLLLSTSEVKIATTMDSGKFATISAEEILDFPDETSHINLVEAKLINYFKPEFNEKFKNWYVPEEHHKSYDDYYKKKFNSMVITFENLFPCSFYTDHVKDFTVPFEIIDYSIIGSENFFESVIDPYINLKEKQK
ncbi:type I restriction endonuclease subunit S [Streptococcus mutans]|nr:type I restriction endonuclease subunit S [Streptococcus mutans]MCB5122944.1 type I restriction endonuclease subunit S [Streptococcus mutans]